MTRKIKSLNESGFSAFRFRAFLYNSWTKSIIIFQLFCGLISFAGATDYNNRTFTAVEFGNQTNRPADVLNTESKKLNNIVEGSISIKTNSYALEKKTVFAWGYPACTSAWNAVVNYNGSESNYTGKTFDNVGWVRGTKSVGTNRGAFLWTMKNYLSFKSSETDKWAYGSGWVVITNVMVAGLTNYPPMTDQSADWPDMGQAKSSYPGDNQGESKSFQVDLTTYFQLAIPDIFVSPSEAVAGVGGSAVQFTAVGTNIQYGVAWSIDPSGVTSGATIQVAGYSVNVTPGTVPQVYKIRAAVSNCPDFYDEGKLTVIKTGLKSIEFTSDHESGGVNILKDNTNDWTDTGTAYVEPEWVKSPARNNPISHTKNVALAAKVTVKVEPSGVTFELIGDGPDDYLDFHKTGNNSTGSDQELTVTADANLPDEVCTLTEDIDWTIKVGTNEFFTDSSGEHKIYVTYGTPSGSEVTEQRVNDVCTAADGESTIDGCASAISTHLMSYQYSGQNNFGPSPIWLLHDGTNTSLCPGLAIFINKHFQILGLGEGSIKYCRAMPDGTYAAEDTGNEYLRLCTPGNSGHPDPTTHDDIYDYEWLYMIDGSANANNYEATCLFNSKYYAVGVGIFNTPKDVVMGAFGSTNNINWYYKLTTNSIGACFISPWTEAP